MATIFTVSGSEKLLVLNQSEALVYPFNFGDWKELRIGGFFSLTPSGSLDGMINSSLDEIKFPRLPYTGLNQVSWGIINAGDTRPSTVGSFFAGVHLGTGLPAGTNSVQRIRADNSGCDLSIWQTQASYVSNTNGNSYPLIISSGEQTLFSSFYVDQGPAMVFPGATGATITTKHAIEANFNGIKYTYDSVTKNLSVAIFGGNLISKMDSYQNGTPTPLTGYCDRVFLPESLILMLPFQNTFIRAHSLLIKKYS